MMLVLAMLLASAQEPSGTLSEQALAAYKADEPLTARRQAIEALALNPDDFVAHYVIGEVYFNEDANLPRAAYHLRKADELFTRDKPSLGEEAWRVHWEALRSRMWLAEEMEQPALFYELMDRYNVLYKPKMHAERAWRLMKDERFAESRQVAEEGLQSDDPWQQALGGNVLCALEALVRDRPAAIEACMQVIERSRAQGYDLTVEAFNASTTTLAAGDHVKTRELLELATRGQRGLRTNPWGLMAELELSEGRGTEAIAAVKKMQAWRLAQEPRDSAQNRAGSDATVALLLYAAGASEDGLRLIDRALDQPDRRANTTATGDTTKGMHTLLRRALRRLDHERQQELDAGRWFFVRAYHALGRMWPDPTDWEDTFALQGLFTDKALFDATFVLFYEGGLMAPPWMLGDLVPLLGPGVVQAALDQQRVLEKHQPIHAYYDALETEIAWTTGQGRTVALADRALAGLPKEEVLLRARVAALAADHGWRKGDTATALQHYQQAFQLDPGVFRRLGLGMPATIQGSGAVGSVVAATLGRSPRFFHSSRGFRIDVTDNSVCISTAGGNQLQCVSMPDPAEPTEPPTPEVPPAERLAQAVHNEVFSLPMNLSRIDMQSLDGTTRLESDARRKAIDDVLGGKKKR